MCGITGAYAFSESGKQFFSKIDNATRTLQKRGPDNVCTISNEICALGHTRLSIIDTSSAGNQPLTDSTGRYTIVFNGEFYNYAQYIAELKNDGVVFQSSTDTEVFLYLYIKYGVDFLEKINGFFACAIYDNHTQSIFIARDRMGIKPLHIFQNEHAILFASELKALIEFGIPKQINNTALHLYFQLNYIPGPISVLEHVRKLEPGNYIYIQNKNISQKQYFTLSHQNISTDSYSTAKNKIKNLLNESVKKRLISDVPIGSFLSGGIDSSVIASLASNHTDKLYTFSVGYKDEPFFDETKYAKLVAKKIQSEHTIFELTNNDLYEELDDILHYIDEPFADSSAIAVYILSKRTKNHITVALSGDGADELFSGYNKHFAHLKTASKSFFNTLLKNSNTLFNILPGSRNGKFSNLVRQLQKYSNGLKLSDVERYWLWCSITPEIQVNNLLKSVKNTDFYEQKNNYTKHINSSVNSVLLSDLHLVLPYDMLTKVDLMSMANSLEVRTPFLDHNLVNYVNTLPEHYKITPDKKKKILQDTFREDLPEEIYNRPKHGFEVPLLSWLQNDLRSKIEDDLLSDTFISEQNIFNPIAITSLKNRLQSQNPGDIAAQIWALIVFQTWYKKYLL